MFLSFLHRVTTLLLPCFLLAGCAATKAQTPPILPPVPTQTDRKQTDIWQTDDCDLSLVDKEAKLVAITFDDAPTRRLNALLEVFIQFNKSHPLRPASATLFCNGCGMNGQTKESLYTAFAMGIELGNHSFSHLDLTTLSVEEVEKEIRQVDEILQDIDGKSAHLFRAPYGKINERVKGVCKAPVIDWFIDTVDWAERSPQGIVEKTFERLQDGAIILLHDGYESTVDGIKALLPALDKAGYQAVSVSQLAKAHGCTLRAGHVYTRARKQYKKA